jgi:hypothetical protein
MMALEPPLGGRIFLSKPSGAKLQLHPAGVQAVESQGQEITRRRFGP